MQITQHKKHKFDKNGSYQVKFSSKETETRAVITKFSDEKTWTTACFQNDEVVASFKQEFNFYADAKSAALRFVEEF